MADATTTDPHGRLESLGYKGTDTLEEASGVSVVSSSGEVAVKGLEADFIGWATPHFEPTGSEGFVDETARMRYRIGRVENEIAQFQQVHQQLRQAQEAVGEDDLYSLLTTIGTIQNDVTDLAVQIEELEKETPEDPQQSVEQQPTETGAMETSGSAGMYVKLSQVVFVALGILSIYLSISLQSGPWPIVATFAVPILFALAFAGVIAERSQLQVTHDNNVS
jgi:hypothetical protein